MRSTLRFAVGFLLLSPVAPGCSGVSSVRPRLSSETPRTIAMVGDHPVSVTTGAPGDALASDLDGPERGSRSRGRISGRVVDPRGRPVAGALVRLADGGRDRGRAVQVRTDEAGGFTIHGLSPGSTYTLIAESESEAGGDGEPQRGRVVADAPDPRVQIRLGRDGGEPPARRVRRASERDEWDGTEDPLDDPEEDRGPRLNEEDLPPAPEAESFRMPATASRTEPRRRTSRTAWRRGGSDEAVASAGPVPERDEPDPEPRPEPRASGRSDFAAHPAPPPEDDDGPNPLPPALERPPATARQPASWRDPDTSETANRPALADAPPAAEAPGAVRTAPPDVASAPVDPPAEPLRTEPDPPPRDPPVASIPNPEPPAESPPPMVEPSSRTPNDEPADPAPVDPPKASGPDSNAEPTPIPVPPSYDPPPPSAGNDNPVPDGSSAAPEGGSTAPEGGESTAPVGGESTAPGPLPGPAPAGESSPAPPAEAPPVTGEEAPAPPASEPSGPPAEESGPIEEPPGLRAEAAPAARPTWSDLAARGVANRLTSAYPLSTRPGRREPRATDPPADRPRIEPTGAVAEMPGTVRAACLLDGKTQRIVNFQLPDLEGRPVRLRDFDADLILLDFWGTWCGPCLRSIPHLVELQRQYGGRLQVIGIAAEQAPPEERAATVGQVARDLGVTYPILLAEQDGRPCPLLTALHIGSYPTMVLLDRQGHILWRDSGAAAATVARLDRAIAARTELRPGVIRR